MSAARRLPPRLIAAIAIWAILVGGAAIFLAASQNARRNDITQRFQQLAQDRIVTPLLSCKLQRTTPPLFARILNRVAFLRRIPGRVLGLGVRPEHVRSPETIPPAPRP